jgi:hypothetical protein
MMMMALPATLDLAGPLALLDDWPEEALACVAAPGPFAGGSNVGTASK